MKISKNVLIIERKKISVRLADKKPEYLIAEMNNLIIAGNGSILISKSVSKSSIHKCTFQILLRILTFPKTGAFFLLYEGCFQLNETPAKERTDAENNNHVCNDYCDREGKTFSATIGERCLCFDSRPANSLSKGECDTSCPKTPPTDAKEGSSGCKDLGCCGSTENSAVTVVQTIKISREQLGLKKHGKNP